MRRPGPPDQGDLFPVPARRTSCGVLVTDGRHLLLGHATRSALWDIPKGIAEPGEDFAAAARRELEEETGLQAPAEALIGLGLHAYLRGKDLALYAWCLAAMPDAAGLRCRSVMRTPEGRWIPEFDAFAVLPWAEAVARVGRTLARVLGEVRGGPAWPFHPGT
ncbi:NUDIX hydrolase [Roseicella aerolata]|uniref:NUDIX domain-containing protein n=1 Tax=Roseicella aerolata TaxID=2883479 RepID=A0A9X1L9H7_9PROT|nr:NUDIX domain-containing protein [Roseicella aerolata]MCB4823704.1 NUDIX domain-containing protein [Roseicella aerolata]